MLMVTTDSIEGRSIEKYLGVVNGTDVYLATGSFGGGLMNQEKLFSEAFSLATEHITKKAKALGADAIIGLQTTALPVGKDGYVVLVLSGTAVKLA